MQVRGHLPTICAVAILTACSSSSGPHDTGPTSGTVSGKVSSSQGGGIGGAMVVVTPSGGTALTAVTTDSTGAYQVTNVPVGAGSVTVSHLPSICSARDSAAYSGLAGGKSSTANVTVPCTFATTGIVAWLSIGSSLAGFTAAQLTQGGFFTPMTVLVGQGTEDLAFDGSGNLWVTVDATSFTTQKSYVYEYQPSQLTTPSSTALAPAVAVQMPDGFTPIGIAFDRGGTLWVTGIDVGVLYGFSTNQLATSGAPTPAHAFQLRDDSATSLLTATFAANGDLWIAGQDPNNGAGMLLRLTSAQLGSPNGRLLPTDSMLRGRGLDPSIDPAYALAFDAAGNLWIGGGGGAGGGSYLAMYSSNALPGSRGDGVVVGPTMRINANLTNVNAMAFDRSGNLWDWPGYDISHPVNYLLRYPADAIAAGRSEKPDVTDSLNAGNLSLLSPNGFVFTPR